MDNRTPRAPRSFHWTKVHIYRYESNGTFRPVYDNAEKAKALIYLRDKRRVMSGYTLVPMRVIFDIADNGENTIHALSLLWYRKSENGEWRRILDADTLIRLATIMLNGDVIPDRCSTGNFDIDWTGIEEKVTPFNPPRFKLID